MASICSHRDEAYCPRETSQRARRYYAWLGFSVSSLGEDLAEVACQSHAFLLQNFYDEKYASYYMMQLLVPISRTGGSRCAP